MCVKIALLCLVVAFPSASYCAPLTLSELQRLPRDCPIIYDNDWLRDVVDDEYLFAKAHLGQANLRGLIVTKDLWDQGRLYKIEQGLKNFNENIALARRSGWTRIPDPVLGADRVFEKPSSGRIEDTKPIECPGADLIVREARKASPKKPLVVFVGGPLNTVASAYLKDPSIASKMVVMMTDLDGYNGQDKWANYIVTTRCRLVNFGASPLWWPQPPNPSVVPPERFSSLPDTPITREMHRVAQEYQNRRAEGGRDDGFGDGAGLFLFFKPQSWLEVQKMRVPEFWRLEKAESGPYHFLDAVRVDFEAMREEFFSTIKLALERRGK